MTDELRAELKAVRNMCIEHDLRASEAIAKLEARAIRAEAQRDACRDEIIKLRHQLDALEKQS